jgi:hypothetical protein
VMGPTEPRQRTHAVVVQHPSSFCVSLITEGGEESVHERRQTRPSPVTVGKRLLTEQATEQDGQQLTAAAARLLVGYELANS